MNKKRKSEKNFLTTSEIADYCGVSFRTVIRWVQKGMLVATRLPGRGDHRIAKDDFKRFIEQYRLGSEMNYRSENKEKRPLPGQILIVDDDNIMADSIGNCLKSFELNILVAENGLKAGLFLATEKIDLVTLDLNMPGLNGEEVLKIIRARWNKEVLKVLIISGSDEKSLKEYLELGGNDYLMKPFTALQLKKKVAQLLGKESIDGDQQMCFPQAS